VRKWPFASLARILGFMIPTSIIVVSATDEVKGGRPGCTAPESVPSTSLEGSIMTNLRLIGT
jgi:hypothetical protein